MLSIVELGKLNLTFMQGMCLFFSFQHVVHGLRYIMETSAWVITLFSKKNPKNTQKTKNKKGHNTWLLKCKVDHIIGPVTFHDWRIKKPEWPNNFLNNDSRVMVSYTRHTVSLKKTFMPSYFRIYPHRGQSYRPDKKIHM